MTSMMWAMGLLVTPLQFNNSTTEAITVLASNTTIPRKIAERLQTGEFIELHELLPSWLGIPLLDDLSQSEADRWCKRITEVSQGVTYINTYILEQ